MIPVHLLLAQRIQDEVKDLEKTVQRIQRNWARARAVAVNQDVYIDSVALNLHAFYAGLERLFELIAEQVDGGKLGGAAWHVELLRQMSVSLERVRPSVISPESIAALDEYRKFRHLVRHVYAVNLDPGRMGALVNSLAPTWEQVRNELLAFADFLEQLARADEA